MHLKESQIRSMIRDLLLEQDYKEGAGGYEYISKDKKIYITKSPRSKRASRETPLFVSKEKNPKAWNAIASRHFPELLDTEKKDASTKEKESNKISSEKKDKEVDTSKISEKDLAIKDKEKKKSKEITKKSWDDIDLGSWLKAAEDTLDAVYYKGNRYQAYGFVNYEKQKGALVIMPFKDYKDLKFSSTLHVKDIPKDTSVKLLKGGSISRNPKKGTRRVFIPWNTKNVELEITSLTKGMEDATVGDQIAELLSIPAGLPVIGIPSDLANTIIYAALEPPKYFLSFLSLFGVVPILGEVCAILRGVKALRILKSGDEAAAGILKFINSSEPLRNTLRGKDLGKLIKDNREFVFKILEDNSRVITSLGFDSTKIVTGLKEFTEEFLKAYAKYAKYTGLTTRKEIQGWFLLTHRSLGTIIEDEIMNSKEVYEKVKATGIFASFDVAPTGDLEADMEKVSRKMEATAGDYTDEMIASLEKLETDVIEKSGVSLA